MTSLAFILGVLPLVKATGAGAATQHSVGTGILGGMIAATLVGVFFTPLFYWAAMTYLSRSRTAAAPAAATDGDVTAPAAAATTGAASDARGGE
jgi:multidrug efflux pump